VPLVRAGSSGNLGRADDLLSQSLELLSEKLSMLKNPAQRLLRCGNQVSARLIGTVAWKREAAAYP
jgi:hypothetical protein